MDYKDKYEQALKRAKAMIKVADNQEETYNCAVTIFPELTESVSEDEKIRKEIMDFIDTKTIESDERRNRWFSYFEKYKPISFTSLDDTKVKMSLIQYISELNQDVVHLHPGIETCNEWIAWLEKQRQEPRKVSIWKHWKDGICGNEEAVKETEEYKEWQGDPERQQSFIDFAKFGANYKHKTSNDLEEMLKDYAYQVAYDISHDWLKENATWDDIETAVKLGAQWQKEHLLKPADGDDLPEIDREVIALLSNGKVVYAHRPQEYWDGKNIATGEVTRHYPKRYDKGGWNIPDVKWWLDIELPKTEE